MLRRGTFAYTWDLVGDPRAAQRIAELGVDTVTLQAAYHSVRAITAWHPEHRIVHADHAAAYFRLRGDRWPGRLRPRAPQWGVADDDRFGTAAAALTAAGLRVEAWLVLTHSSALGRRFPELTVRNAYGERYPYALCPAQPEVRDYTRTLIAEVCDQYEVPLMLEACGWLGFEHGSHHEKTSGADLSPGARALLSICCCTACATPDDTAQRIREAVDAELQRGIPARLEDVPGLDAVIAHRTRVIGAMVSDAAAHGREVLLMAADDPLATGPDVGLDLAAFHGPVDAYVLKCWGDADAAVAAVRAAAARTRVPIVANVTLLESPGAAELTARLAEAGATQVRYYHAGLASPARLKEIR